MSPAPVLLLGEIDSLVDLIGVPDLFRGSVAGPFQAVIHLFVVLVGEFLHIPEVRHEVSLVVVGAAAHYPEPACSYHSDGRRLFNAQISSTQPAS